jgi:hypothetical protein
MRLRAVFSSSSSGRWAGLYAMPLESVFLTRLRPRWNRPLFSDCSSLTVGACEGVWLTTVWSGMSCVLFAMSLLLSGLKPWCECLNEGLRPDIRAAGRNAFVQSLQGRRFGVECVWCEQEARAAGGGRQAPSVAVRGQVNEGACRRRVRGTRRMEKWGCE